MTRLKIKLLGTFEVTLDEEPVNDFAYDKVRLLLAYLVTQAHRVHRRDILATLLWQNQSSERARANLRKALAHLRQLLKDTDTEIPFFHTSRNTIQFNYTSSYKLDVNEFTTFLAVIKKHQYIKSELNEDFIANLEEAVSLYKGAFLDQILVNDNDAFEEWLQQTRDELHTQVVNACMELVKYYDNQKHWQKTQYYAQRLLQLEPWKEFAHQALIRVLAQQGQKDTALQQYQRCRRILLKELGVEPDITTNVLYKEIRAGIYSQM
jgi:DNA-binding SARP family transcriptional activator